MQIKDELLDINMINNSKKNLLDLFIRRTAVLTCTNESMVEKIIKDQWHHANKVTQPFSCIGEIDFPNIGTLYMSKTKAKRKLRKLEEKIKNIVRETDDAEQDKEKIEAQIYLVDTFIRSIKLKTKQIESDEC